MKPLTPPTIDVKSVFDDCNTFQDSNMRSRLEQSLPYIILASSDFEQRAQAHETYKIGAHNTINGLATKQDMIKLYEQKLVPKNSDGG